MPEGRFPVERGQMIGEAVPCPAGAGGFQVVDQRREIERGMDADQQVDVIRLAAELDEFAAPAGKDFRKGFAKVSQQFRVQAGPAVFRHENDMQPKVVDRMGD